MRRKSDDLEPVVISAFKHFCIILIIMLVFTIVFFSVTSGNPAYIIKKLFVRVVNLSLLNTFFSVLMGYFLIIEFVAENRYLIDIVCYLWGFLWGLKVLVACRNVYRTADWLTFMKVSKAAISRIQIIIPLLLFAYYVVSYSYFLHKRKLIRTRAKENS